MNLVAFVSSNTLDTAVDSYSISVSGCSWRRLIISYSGGDKEKGADNCVQNREVQEGERGRRG